MRTNHHNLFSMTVLAFVGSISLAITEGEYRSSGKTHFLENKITFSKWGEEYQMKAKFVQNEHTFDMVVQLTQQSENYFYGPGKVYVRYPNGMGCVHKMAASLYAYPDKVYLKENTPKSFPYNPNGSCKPAGPYEWFLHQEPFILTRTYP